MIEGRLEAQLEKILRMPATNERAQLSRQSSGASEVMNQVEALMLQTKYSYPTQEIPEETLEMWIPLWLELTLDFGLEAMREALRGLMRKSRFFPHPSELDEELQRRRSSRQVKCVERPLTRTERIRRFGPKHLFSQAPSDSVEFVSRAYGTEAGRQYAAELAEEERKSGPLRTVREVEPTTASARR